MSTPYCRHRPISKPTPGEWLLIDSNVLALNDTKYECHLKENLRCTISSIFHKTDTVLHLCIYLSTTSEKHITELIPFPSTELPVLPVNFQFVPNTMLKNKPRIKHI